MFAGSCDGTPQEGAEFTYQVVSGLRQKKIDVVLGTYSHEIYLYLKNKNMECIDIFKEMSKFKVKNVIKELREYELKYDFCAERILLCDIDYRSSVKRNIAFREMVKLFKFWECLLDKEKPNILFGGENRYGNLVPYYLCKKKNILYELLYVSPIVKDSFAITENTAEKLSELEKYWKENKNRALNKEELKKVREYITEFIYTKKRPLFINTKPKIISFQKIKYALERIYASFFLEDKNNPYFKSWRGIKNYFLMNIRSHLSKWYFELPRKNEKYIYYPLHVDLETILLFYNHQYVTQERIVEIISYNLPAGYKLYVKGHPVYIGGHRLSLFKNIKKLPNVRILNPLVDGRTLIKNASAIAVITGTAGFEGLLCQKPVITFGNAYYDISELTFKIKDMNFTDRVINDAVNMNSFDEEKLYRFLNAYFKTVYPGRVYFTGLYHSNEKCTDSVLNKKNVNNVILSIEKHIKHKEFT